MIHPIISKDPVNQSIDKVVTIGSAKRNERTVQVIVLESESHQKVSLIRTDRGLIEKNTKEGRT